MDLNIITTALAMDTESGNLGLLELPTELRYIIYDHVLAAFVLTSSTPHRAATINRPPLLDTCSLIRNEAHQPSFDRMGAVLLDRKKIYSLINTEVDASRKIPKEKRQSGYSPPQLLELSKHILLRARKCKDEYVIWIKLLNLATAAAEKWEMAGYEVKMTGKWDAVVRGA